LVQSYTLVKKEPLYIKASLKRVLPWENGIERDESVVETEIQGPYKTDCIYHGYECYDMLYSPYEKCDFTLNVFLKIAIPNISGASFVDETKTTDLLITNYDNDVTYEIDVSDGEFELIGAIIKWTMPEVEEDTELTLTINATKIEGTSEDFEFVLMCVNVPAILSGPTSALETKIIDVIITNYDEDLEYDIDVSDGEFELIGAIIKWTMPEVEEDTELTLTVETTGNETVHTVNCINVPANGLCQRLRKIQN